MSRTEERVNKLKTMLGFFNCLNWDGIKVNFIVSTGRTGTRFLEQFVRLFSPKIDSRHEPEPDLLKLGVNYARGKISYKDAVKTIERSRLWVCDQIRKNDRNVYIEANNNLFSLVPMLWEIFPDAKIVHIVRDGRDFVRSVINRDHYTHKDGIYFKKNLRLQATDFTNDPYYSRWKDMSQFEKVCWEWTKKDSYIYDSIKDNPRAITIKFEEIFDRTNGNSGLWQLINFMEVASDWYVFRKNCESFIDNKFNENKVDKFPRWQQWNDEQRRQFVDIAGERMELYGYDMSDFICDTAISK